MTDDKANEMARLVCKIARENEAAISIETARKIVEALRPEKPTVAYYVREEAGFYVCPKFMGRENIPEKHRAGAVRLVEGDE